MKRIINFLYLVPYHGNFGDELTPLILERIFIGNNYFISDMKHKILYSKENRDVYHISTLGSIMQRLPSRCIVCGTGVNPIKRVPKKNLNIVALRGILSLNYLNKNGYNLDKNNIVFGDPALLIPRLFPEWLIPLKVEYEITLIPHHNDREFVNDFITNFDSFDSRKYKINICYCDSGVDNVINTIRKSKMIITSSLHAIICSEMLNKPVVWIEMKGSSISETRFKYLDYYSSTNRKEIEPAKNIEEALKWKIDKPKYNDEALYNAFFKSRNLCLYEKVLSEMLYKNSVPIKLKFLKRIKTEEKSIFYSLIKYNNDILGFGRTFYNQRFTKKVKLDKNLNIIEDNCVKWTKAADPRCFFHKNKLYVLNNSCTNNSLIDYNTRKHIKIKINGEVGGKNFTFISHSDKLYFIQWMKPFILYEFDIDKENATEVYSDYTETDYEYRGGTPGYKYNKYQLNNEYYGFGHRTYKKNNIVTHDIFLWVLTFNKKKPKISIIDILKPNNAKNICDPTSVIEIDNKKYLITAESEKEWFSDQDYITNVYEIVDNNNID